MKTICIYHGDCPDGFGAAWVVRKAMGEENVEFVPGFHHIPPPDCTGREVILVDFCYKRPVLEKLISDAAKVLVLDHHISAMKEMAGFGSVNAVIRFDITQSGAALTWQHFFPEEPLPRLLAHVQDLDMWRFAIPGTREVMAGVMSYPYDFARWDGFDVDALRADGDVLNRKAKLEVVEVVKATKRVLLIGGHWVPAVNTPRSMADDAAAMLAEDAPFAAAYYDTAAGRRFSLRSSPNGLDVSEIATVYGGGGHARASGFRLSWDDAVAMEIRSAHTA